MIILLILIIFSLDYALIILEENRCWSLCIMHLSLQLFQERLWEKMCMRQSWNVIWDMIKMLFLALSLSNLLLLLSFSNHKHTSTASNAILSNFFEQQWTQTIHNTFWDCHVHFFQQPFSKKLYVRKHFCFVPPKWWLIQSRPFNKENLFPALCWHSRARIVHHFEFVIY